jgi:hypothetical protein
MPRLFLCALAYALTSLGLFGAEPASSSLGPKNHPLEFINTSFENASPLWYEFAPDGTVLAYLTYDHERSSPNRAAGHIHFQLQAKPGSKLTLEFKNLENVWNGTSSSIARELKTVVISEDGRAWKSVPLESLPENRVRLHVEMPGPRLYVARVEPYRLSDLEIRAWQERPTSEKRVKFQQGWTSRNGQSVFGDLAAEARFGNGSLVFVFGYVHLLRLGFGAAKGGTDKPENFHAFRANRLLADHAVFDRGADSFLRKPVREIDLAAFRCPRMSRGLLRSTGRLPNIE